MSLLQISILLCAMLVSKKLLCSCQELRCNQFQNTPLCNGDTVTSTCSIQSPFLLWVIETASDGNFEIDFDKTDQIGDTESTGLFSANLTKHYPDPNSDVSESILQYRFSEKLNGSTFSCFNLINTSLTKSCVIGSNEILPGNVKYLKADQESCVRNLLSWDEPDTGSTAVDHYLVSLEPSTNQCGTQGCEVNALTTHMYLTELENGISYKISVSACNCFACGLATSVQIVAINITKSDLRRRLIFENPIQYMIEKTANNTGYEVLLIWEDLSQSCAISYLVNVTYKDKAGETNQTILTNYYSTPNLDRGREFIVSVAGVNGDVVGPYSPKLCIELEAPGNVLVTSKNLFKSSLGYLLEMEWEPPAYVTCSRPHVQQYIVNFNKQSFPTVDKNLSVYLTNITQDYIQVSISGLNVIGMGAPLTIVVSGAITQTQPVAIFILIFVIISLLITQ